MLNCKRKQFNMSVKCSMLLVVGAISFFGAPFLNGSSNNKHSLSSFLLPHLALLYLRPPFLHPSLFPTHSSFPSCLREHCDWVTITALCGVCSVCHYPCGRRVEWNKAPKLGY